MCSSLWETEASPVFRSFHKEPDLDNTFLLQTDTSDQDVGALSQLGQDGLDHPVTYFNCKLLVWEKRCENQERVLGNEVEHTGILRLPGGIDVHLWHRPIIPHSNGWTGSRALTWDISGGAYYSYTTEYQLGTSNSNADMYPMSGDSIEQVQCTEGGRDVMDSAVIVYMRTIFIGLRLWVFWLEGM